MLVMRFNEVIITWYHTAPIQEKYLPSYDGL